VTADTNFEDVEDSSLDGSSQGSFLCGSLQFVEEVFAKHYDSSFYRAMNLYEKVIVGYFLIKPHTAEE
jgi:hypothetical protein